MFSSGQNSIGQLRDGLRLVSGGLVRRNEFKHKTNLRAAAGRVNAPPSSENLGNPKPEIRRPKSKPIATLFRSESRHSESPGCFLSSKSPFRASDLFRISDFGLRFSSPYAQKSGTSSLPPFLLRFYGSEKTVRNRPNLKIKKNYSMGNPAKLFTRTMSQAAIFSPRLSVALR